MVRRAQDTNQLTPITSICNQMLMNCFDTCLLKCFETVQILEQSFQILTVALSHDDVFPSGAAKARWIRIPAIVYSTHVATSLIAILCHLLMSDFSQSKDLAPRNTGELLALFSIYFPEFLLPTMVLLDACFSPAYREPVKTKQG